MAQTARDLEPVVPPNKMRIADCGTYDLALDATRTPIASAVGALHGYPIVTFRHETRGFVCAGAGMRWQEARWSVSYMVHDGGIHGCQFHECDEVRARAYFDSLTDSQTVSRMRQQEAMYADKERETAEACRVAAAPIPVEVAKTYKSGWQWRAAYPGMRDWCGFAKTKAGALLQGRAALEHRMRCDMPRKAA